jgi:hypothetical protein
MEAYYDTILRLTPLTETAHERLARTGQPSTTTVLDRPRACARLGSICSIMRVTWLLFTD